jgi:CubicO group peptidase (beta-lactamase class C family)
MAEARVPGVAIAVVRSRALTLTSAGVRNRSAAASIDASTIFDAASLSKPVFAYAVLQLIDAGRLSLDTPLARYVPDFVTDDPRAVEITVRHVLSHTSGLPNFRRKDRPFKTHFPPGERFSYSSEAFVWLQEAVMRRLVFDPLKMRRSSYVWQPAFETNHADPHDAELVPDVKRKRTSANMAGSLQTSAGDFGRFLQAVLSGARLKPETARRWLEPEVKLTRRCIVCLTFDSPETNTGIAWGLGWGLEPRSGTFFQWGDIDKGRFKTLAMGTRRQRTAVVILTNGFNGMTIMPELVADILPGRHPAFEWMGYPAHVPVPQ